MISQAFFALLVFTLTSGGALATTYTIPAGSGTLTYTATPTQLACMFVLGAHTYSGEYYDTTYSSFSFTISGITTPLNGMDHSVYSPDGIEPGSCPKSSFPPVTLTGAGVADVVFTPSGETGGSASLTGTPGFINPKYVVVGVTYAPPGPSSYAQYTNITTIGNTSTISSTFSNDVGFGISVSNQASIPAAVANSSGGVTLTFSSSTDFTTTQNTSTTVTLSKTTSLSYKTPGVTNAFSPVNHDYDYIWLWLNPEMLFTVTSATSTIQWTGYAYDPADPSGTGGPDIYAVQVGCLNGDFSCPSANTILARTWATDVTWPSGQGPGLTTADKANIILSDPPASSSYTLLNSLPSTTSDGRFTQGTYPPNPLIYSPGELNTMYSLSQTDTQSVASGASYQVKQSFGVSEKLSASFLGIWGTSTTYTQNDTLIWNYSWLNTLTTTTTVTDALSVTGPPDPPPPYTGPGEFIYYQDNIFGTFLFFPSN
jgi:hypothetical protein